MHVRALSEGSQRMKSYGVEGAFMGPKKAELREAPDTFNFLRHVMRAIWSVRPKGSHRCVSLRETPLKPVQSLKHTQPKTQRSKPL